VARDAKLQAKLDSLPDCPGAYIFKDARGKIIYVGKAKSLRSRARSYFRSEAAQGPRTEALVRRIRGIDFIVAGSEVEALILECNLIKHFRPRYNVSLKDDKKYPYIKVTTREPFPSIAVTRTLGDREARYFGPYTDAKAMRRSLKFLTEVFPVRTCKRALPLKEPDRGCLNYHIGKCLGPCRGEITSEAYKRIIRQVCQFLSGRVARLGRQLRSRMDEEAAALRFEEAGRLRDRIRALEKIAQRQVAVSTDWKDRDVVAVRTGRDRAVAAVLKVREGKIVGKETYRLAFDGQPPAEEVLASFLEQYLCLVTEVPGEIVLEGKLEGVSVIEQWLEGRTGRRIRVLVPRGGKARDLVEMAAANAQLALAQEGGGRAAPRVANSVKELARWLNLPEAPDRIAAFDVSTTQGAQPVGSRVYFRNGRPVKGLYRHYAVRIAGRQDDFAMMREIVARSWAHVESGEEERPNLLLIDGGKGQVASAIKGLADAGARRSSLPPVVGIAKRLDELWLADRPDPVQIPHGSSALRLLQRLRDEAHRFAVTYHRKLRGREGTRSLLEEVPGIGPVLARRLLTEFGSIEGARKAGAQALAAVRGMTAARAEAVVAALGRAPQKD